MANAITLFLIPETAKQSPKSFSKETCPAIAGKFRYYKTTCPAIE
jgi:hypothetical protein